ncbi:hypothetical protein AB7952_11235 [Streptomyces sp. PG2]
MQHSLSVPPVDFQTNGHLPYLVDTAQAPEVTQALAQLEVDKQAARDAGLYDEKYERLNNELGKLFTETNSVGPVLEVVFQGIVNDLAKEHGLRLVRANEGATEELLVWPESGIVVLPHGMTAMDALDQIRAALADEGRA